MLNPIIKLMRPRQWVKNLFVFLPMFFGGRMLDAGCWVPALWAFLAFSLAASSIYCLNDARDAAADALHPKKCSRPIPAGLISRRAAYILSFILGMTALCITLFMPERVSADYPHPWDEIQRSMGMAVIALYLALNFCYCMGLKNVSILDVMMVSVGFVLRIGLGGVACGIRLSPWIVVMVFLLALFMAFAKRRDDLVIAVRSGRNPRRSSQEYNIPFLNQTLGILGAVMMVGYMMYCFSPATIRQFESEYMYITGVFVLGALLRYLQIALVEESSGSPTEIVLHDRFIQLCILLWAATFALLIYL